MQSVLLSNQRRGVPPRAASVRGLGMRGVDWGRFMTEEHTASVIARVSLELVAWVIDLMLQFIHDVIITNYTGFTDHSLQYVMQVIVPEFRPIEFQAVKSLPNMQIPSVVLLTMKDNENEPSGVIFIDGNDAEVFFPFPMALSLDKNRQNKIDDVLAGLSKTFNRPLNKKMFTFQPDFVQSNVWNVYYILLRLRYKFETVQKMFLDRTISEQQRQEKAFFTYFTVGHLISRCVRDAADNKVPIITGEHGVFRMYFSSKHKAELRVDDKMRAQLVDLFKNYKLKKEETEWLSDLLPPKTGVINATWPKDNDKQWDNFIPVDNAKPLVLNFSKD